MRIYPMNAWIVSVTTPGHPQAEMRLFAVAEDDPADAVDAVERAVSSVDDQLVRTVSCLSDESEAQLGLEPGEVMEITA
jgi:hypothetical protein